MKDDEPESKPHNCNSPWVSYDGGGGGKEAESEVLIKHSRSSSSSGLFILHSQPDAFLLLLLLPLTLYLRALLTYHTDEPIFARDCYALIMHVKLARIAR